MKIVAIASNYTYKNTKFIDHYKLFKTNKIESGSDSYTKSVSIIRSFKLPTKINFIPLYTAELCRVYKKYIFNLFLLAEKVKSVKAHLRHFLWKKETLIH